VARKAAGEQLLLLQLSTEILFIFQFDSISGVSDRGILADLCQARMLSIA
jgi:hypothetical protein